MSTDERDASGEAEPGETAGGAGGAPLHGHNAGHVLIDETDTAPWYVYRRPWSPLDPAAEWSDWDDVRDGARGANAKLCRLLEKNHARAVTAILDRTDWPGRGAHHCGTLQYRQPGTYVLVYAVRSDVQTYYASPVPLSWMRESPAAPR